MQIFKSHHSFTYLLNRVSNKIVFTIWGHNKPWLTPKAIRFIDRYFKSINYSGQLFEWGSGNSTIWFAKRNYTVVSIENSVGWHNKILKKSDRENINNIKLILINDNPELYVNEIRKYPDLFFDCIVVDGIERVKCAFEAISKLKNGGVLIIDDIHRYLSIKTNAALFQHAFGLAI